MRTISQLYGLQATEALEITLQLTVHWQAGPRVYASRDMGFPGIGKIISWSGLQAQRDFNQTGTAGSCSVVLDDRDLTIKALQQTSQIEGVKCSIAIYLPNVPGIASSIFEGRLTAPLWDEGERTLTFDIIPHINVGYVGYAIKESDVSKTQKVAIGKTIPVVFGQAALVASPLIQEVPEVRLTKPFYFGYDPNAKTNIWTQIKAGTGVTPAELQLNIKPQIKTLLKTEVDDSLTNLEQENVMYVEDASAFEYDKPVTVQINKVLFKGSFKDKNTFNITEANSPYYTNLVLGNRDSKDPDYENFKVAWLKPGDLNNYNLLNKFVVWTWTHTVKDNTGATNTVKDYYENVVVRQEGVKLWFKYPFIKQVFSDKGFSTTTYDTPAGQTSHICPKSGFALENVYPIHPSGLILDFVGEWLLDLRQKVNQKNYARVSGANSNYEAVLKQLALIQNLKQCFWHAEPGEVATEYKGPVKDRYIVSLGEVESIDSIYALRQNADGKVVCVPVPKKYYKIILTEKFLNTKCGLVEMVQPLTSYDDQGWSRDVIYCTCTSTTTSNTARQIRTILEECTDLKIDGDSFDDVEDLLENYPSNFALYDVKDALQMCTEMAWQARCGLMIDGTSVGIKYLSKRQNAANFINEDGCDLDSLGVAYTPIEELITKVNAYYKVSGAPAEFDPEVKIVYTENVDKYGVREADWPFYIYNNAYCVQKSLEFWGHRRSNSWKLARCRTSPDYIRSQIFEEFDLQFSGGALGALSVHAHLDAYNFDIATDTLDLAFWLPTISGKVVEDKNAYMNDAKDNIDDYVYNPATARAEESEYTVASNLNKLREVDELIRELRKQQSAHLIRGKITAIDGNKLTGTYYPNCDPGLVGVSGVTGIDTSGSVSMTVYDANPGQHKEVGTIITFETGQDGVYYSSDVAPPSFWGVPNGISSGTASVKLRRNMTTTDKLDKVANTDISMNVPINPFNGRYPIFYDNAGSPYMLFIPYPAIIRIISKVSGSRYSVAATPLTAPVTGGTPDTGYDISSLTSGSANAYADNIWEFNSNGALTVAGATVDPGTVAALDPAAYPTQFLAYQLGVATDGKPIYIFQGRNVVVAPGY